MTALRLCAAVATLAFAVNTAFAHGDHEKTSYYVGDAERKCTADGDRCAGADHKPFVKYAPCCGEEKACLEDEHLGWGRFCIDAPKTYTEKCYKTGVRCMGEKKKPYVEYMPCCDEKDECVKAHDDWGSFCVPVKEETKKYEPIVKNEKVYKKKEVKDEDEDKKDYKKDYEKKYESYYKKYGSDDDYGDDEYGLGKGKGKKFEKKFNLFPNVPTVIPAPVTAGPVTPRPNAALSTLLGLPAEPPLGCSALAAASPAAADVVPPNTNADRGDVFLEGPVSVCNIPGRGLSLAGVRAFLDATCSRLRVVDPTVECWIQEIRGAPVSRMGVTESDSNAAVRQVGVLGVVQVRIVTIRCIFRGGRFFLATFVRIITFFFVQFPVSVGIVPTISPST